MIGYDSEADSLDSDKLRHYILGGHVADYMRYLSEEDEEKYKSHFSRFIKEGLTADSVSGCDVEGVGGLFVVVDTACYFLQKLETLYRDAHQKIRADPTAQKKTVERKEAKVKR